MPVMFAAVWLLVFPVSRGPFQDLSDRDLSVVRAALQAVAVQEFSKVNKDQKPSMRVGRQSIPVRQAYLKTLQIYVTSRGWPAQVAERLQEANRQVTTLGPIVLEGIEIVESKSVAAEASATLPGYVENEAFVLVQFQLKARHVWVVRLFQRDGAWQVREAIMIGAS